MYTTPQPVRAVSEAVSSIQRVWFSTIRQRGYTRSDRRSCCDTTPGLISISSPNSHCARPKSVYTWRRWQCAVMAGTIEDIRVVRAELRKFDAQQTEFAGRFHAPVVDANLRAASEGHDNPIFREGLALCVEDLAACVRNPGRGCGSRRCFFVRSGIEGEGVDRRAPPNAGRSLRGAANIAKAARSWWDAKDKE